MTVNKTYNFLPEVFKTTPNQKFLNATMDQLVSEPNFQRVSGYIGRVFAPTYKSTDNYLLEDEANRQNYQLEPCLTAKDSTGNIEFFNSYTDLLNQIEYYGGIVDNQSRLFTSKSYSFGEVINLDKLVNFTNYYWMPLGPPAVSVFAGTVANNATYTVTRNLATNAYTFTGFGIANNPDIILARGGVYQFVVNQPGYPFWIQTSAGISGTVQGKPNISSRDVYGVENNGTDNGVITFYVPQITSEDFYVNMPLTAAVDVATDLTFSQLSGMSALTIDSLYGGIDGISATTLAGKLISFVSNDATDSAWTTNNLVVIPASKRISVWQIQLIPIANGDSIVQFVWVENIQVDNKILVKSGTKYANIQFYQSTLGILAQIPQITAPFSELFYNDGVNQSFSGKIALTSSITSTIDVVNSILGKQQYTSPTGVTFTNGLKVIFDNTAIPASYSGNTYYVDGVGTSIRLVNETTLVTPELGFEALTVSYDTYNYDVDSFDESISGPFNPDYLTINRSSIDANPWSRSNMWFHKSVMDATNLYNSTNISLPTNMRASRPIIEFSPDLQLFNHGKIALPGIDYLDFTVSDAFNQVAGPVPYVLSGGSTSINVTTAIIGQQTYTTPTGLAFTNGMRVRFDSTFTPINYADSSFSISGVGAPSGIQLTEILDLTNTLNPSSGSTIIFANDYDPNVNNVVFSINIVTINGHDNYQLLPIANISTFNSVVPSIATIVPLAAWTGISTELFNSTVRQLLISQTTGTGTVAAIPAAVGLPITTTLNGVISLNIGVLIGYNYWFNGTSWIKGQEKFGLNIAPAFDIIDSTGVSYKTYNASTFAGCDIFSYLVGTGLADSVLGFPLSYRSIGNVGDIEFQNNFDSDTFTYLIGNIPQTVNINQGFIPKILTATTYQNLNVWSTTTDLTKQYQVFNYVFNGSQNEFVIDVLPDAMVNELTPTLKVYVNYQLISPVNYSIQNTGLSYYLVVNGLNALDQVSIHVYSTSKNTAIGYYEIPVNLDKNALNETFTTLTLGQMRNHLATIASNYSVSSGFLTETIMRDVDMSISEGDILQHSSPAVYGFLFLTNQNVNFINALDLARQEYTKFKNKFLNTFDEIATIGITDPAIATDFAMAKIILAKTSSDPWYYSGMVPFGSNKITINYTVLNPEIVEYEINSVYNNNILSNTAVLVYHNGIQLLVGVDYTFSQVNPTIIFNSTFAYGDTISISAYNNTDGCFVPETPTKMGMYPKFTPSMFLDSTYQTPTMVIRGHDGSITPAYGDIRDAMLLELESRIYNNIKVSYESLDLDINSFIPGNFRNTEYSVTEFNQIMSGSYMQWVGANKVDYSSNLWFTANNPWTWTYSNSKNRYNGNQLQGYWRGIYSYLYDTDSPNERPWEMLGFSQMPSWWVAQYGPAPYTGGNMVMWSDLEAGLIRQGPTAGINLNYARPGLTTMIPVTDYGILVSPDQLVSTPINSITASDSFVFGDGSPQESAWRKSSEYPFAVQRAIALMKPAMYFSLLSNVQSCFYNPLIDQYVVSNSFHRLRPTDFMLTGQTNGNTIIRSAGYVNWVIDYIKTLGLNPYTIITNLLSTMSLQLGYRAAGFTDKKFLTVMAEQVSPSSTNDSIIVPPENYTVYLHKSTPVSNIVYSAVIIEKTNTGFVVSGYDLETPYFTIIPSNPTGGSYILTEGNLSSVIYTAGISGNEYIAYGTEFASIEEVVDFLTSYGRFLISVGFTFDQFNSTLQVMQDWTLSAKEFMSWVQQGWNSGSVIVISPTNNSINVNYSGQPICVDEITNLPIGSKLLDSNFNVIKRATFTVNRTDTDCTITVNNNDVICLAILDLVQYEHAVIFDNTTVFNDIIYQPELGNRQFRLKIVGGITGDWNGQLSAPGFVYSFPTVSQWQPNTDYAMGDIVTVNKVYYTALQDIPASGTFSIKSNWSMISSADIQTGLLGNFAYNSGVFTNMYDVDTPSLDSNIDAFAMGLIGYRDRSYFDELSVSPTSQVKFYQGFIKQKGTANAVNALTKATFENLSSNLQFYEEWALRVGSYGATASSSSLEVLLDESKYIVTPVSFTLLNSGAVSADSTVVGVYQNTLYKSPVVYTPQIFVNRSDDSDYSRDLQTAGYVNLQDINATLFDMANYDDLNSLLQYVGEGYKIWTVNDFNSQWNVYRVGVTSLSVSTLTYSLDSLAAFTFVQAHNLSVNDVFIVKNFSAAVDGFYVVSYVIDEYNVNVTVTPSLENMLITTPVITVDPGATVVFEVQSMRVANMTDISSYAPTHGWLTTDNLWVDNDTSGGWAVYSKVTPWEQTGIVPTPIELTSANVTTNFGSSVAITSDNQYVFVSAPETNNGEVFVFGITGPNSYALRSKLTPTVTGTTSYGAILKCVGTMVYIAGTGPVGSVQIYGINVSGYFTLISSLTSPVVNDLNYGSVMEVSNDGNWLYITSSTNVYIYHYELQSSGSLGYTYITYIPAVGVTSLSPAHNGLYLVVGQGNMAYGGDVAAGVATLYTLCPYYGAATSLFIDSVQTFALQTPEYNANFGQTTKFVNSGNSLLVGAPNWGSLLHGGVVTRFSDIVNSTKTLELPVTPSTITGNILVNGTLVNIGQTEWYTQVTNFLSGYMTVAATPIDINIAFPAGATLTSNLYINGSQVVIANQGITPWFEVATTNINSLLISNVSATYAPSTLTTDGFLNITYTPNTVVTGTMTVSNVVSSATATIETTPWYVNFSHELNANISGITSNVISGTQNVLTANITTGNLVIIAADASGVAALAALNLTPSLKQTQTIYSPYNFRVNEDFGSYITEDPILGTVFIGSSNSVAVEPRLYDSGTMTLDVDTTTFFDIIYDSGSAYAYDLLTSTSSLSMYSFSQQIFSDSVHENDKFGYTIAANNGVLVIGSPAAATNGVMVGNVYTFANTTSSTGWQLTRFEQPTVDITSFKSGFIYDNNTELRLAPLDILDPNKGKLLGAAQEEIDFVSSYDPARYNAGYDSSLTIDPAFFWGASYVGKVWWDTTSARFIDYEQDSLAYRIANWGMLFPGSSIDVYEWVASSQPPALYAGSGTPKSTAYCQDSILNAVTGNVVPVYYFWVTNKTTIDQSWRRLSVQAITAMIVDPLSQNIPYAALVRNDTISMFNCSNLISDQSTVAHIEYNKIQTDNKIHNEFEMVREGYADEILPTQIVSKMIDSLVGQDIAGNQVPDITLSAADRIGIQIRPRQSMFVNRLLAVQNFVEYVNALLITAPITSTCNLAMMNSEDPLPTSWYHYDVTAGWIYQNFTVVVQSNTELNYIDPVLLAIGDVVLVNSDSTHNNIWVIYQYTALSTFTPVKAQAYRTSDYWNYVDWYAPGYSATTLPSLTVQAMASLSTYSLSAGQVIKVLNTGAGLFGLYLVNSDLSTTVVGIQNGTLQLSDALWNYAAYQIGYGLGNFDTVSFDTGPMVEFRNIITALQNDILTQSLAGEFNNLFFLMLSYILTEQKNIDWAFKTSFISVVHNLRDMAQYPAYTNDNQTYYEDYLNEVKPYRTYVRQYLLNYQGLDTSLMHSTDFDVPPYYDTTTYKWRSLDGTNPADANLLVTSNTTYGDWAQNYTLAIESVSIINAGYGYTVPPVLTVVGGGGSGAVLTPVMDYSTGRVVDVTVVNGGKGYTTTPTIVVSGNGVTAAGAQTFACIPVMFGNNTVRTLNTTIKFDRISFESNVQQWASTTTYHPGDLVAFNNQLYQANATSQLTYFNTSNFTLIPEANIASSADRIMAFYAPTANMPAKVLSQLYTGLEYGALTPVTSVNYDTTQSLPIDTAISSAYTDLLLGTRPQDINISGSNYVGVENNFAPEEFLPGIMFDTLSIKVFTVAPASMSLAAPYLGLPQNTVGINPTYANLIPMFNPIGYRISKLLSNDFFETLSTLSANLAANATTISVMTGSVFENPAVGQTATIYINGEEITYPHQANAVSTTNMITNVTRGVSNTMIQSHTVGSSITKYMIDPNSWVITRISASNTTVLVQPLNITDTLIYVENAALLPQPDINLNNPGVVYINGERIIYYVVDLVNNTLGQIRRGTYGTGSPAPLAIPIPLNPANNSLPVGLSYHPIGSLVEDASIGQYLPAGSNNVDWLNTVSANLIIEDNTTQQSLFVENSNSYLPWLPGQTPG